MGGSISLGLGALLGGTLSAGAGVTSGILGSNAAKTAAQQQAQSAANALQFQQQVFNTQQQNQAPYLAAGTQSLSQLMKGLQSGAYGPGSLGPVPTAPAAFVQPTLAQAEAQPGYQFALQQGDKGLLEGAAAAGGNIGGGTEKALAQYNQNLGETNYGNVFNQALQSYNAGLSGYASQLAGYQTAQGAQQQGFQQLLAPAQLGEGGVQSINNTGTAVSQNVGNLMTQIGNAQAAGTVGSANQIGGALTGAAGSIGGALTLPAILQLIAGPGGLGNNGNGPGTNYNFPSLGQLAGTANPNTGVLGTGVTE